MGFNENNWSTRKKCVKRDSKWTYNAIRGTILSNISRNNDTGSQMSDILQRYAFPLVIES